MDKKIFIIGCGPGVSDLITLRGKNVIKEADLIVGSGRLLTDFAGETIIERFGRENCEVVPGVSSFQYAFCQIKESWKDYRVFSIHGDKDMDTCLRATHRQVGKIFKENDRFILLLDPEHNLKFIKRQIGSIIEAKYRFYVGSNLSMPTEKISGISFADFDNFPEESLSLLIVRREDE